MAGETVLRQDRSNVAVVLNRLLATNKRRKNQGHEQREVGGDSHRVLRFTASADVRREMGWGGSLMEFDKADKRWGQPAFFPADDAAPLPAD